MENEKKCNTLKRITQIVLLALLIFTGLIFLIFPPIWAHNSGVKNLTNQLVKRQVNGGGSTQLGENGVVSISNDNDALIWTIYSDADAFEMARDVNFEAKLLNEQSITGSNDVFGYNCPNYFRFVYNDEYTNKFTEFDRIYNLEYYIELDNYNTISVRLGYYEILLDDFIFFQPLNANAFDAVGLKPKYNVLNLLYYNQNSIDTLNSFITGLNVNGVSTNTYLLHIGHSYQLEQNFLTNYTFKYIHFVNIDRDFYTSLINDAFYRGKDVGFNEGINTGSMGSVFDVLYRGVNSIGSILSIEVLPNISLWLLLSIPLAISIMVIIFKLLRGHS